MKENKAELDIELQKLSAISPYENVVGDFIKEKINELDKKIEQIQREVKYLNNYPNDGTIAFANNFIDINKIKKIPIPEVIGEPNFSKNYLCVNHNDSNPSMHYYEKENRVYCFACGFSGDVIDVYALRNDINITTAIKELNKLYGY